MSKKIEKGYNTQPISQFLTQKKVGRKHKPQLRLKTIFDFNFNSNMIHGQILAIESKQLVTQNIVYGCRTWQKALEARNAQIM